MDFNTNIDDQLVCPNCLGSYLHHSSVTVYERKEDEPDSLQIYVSQGEVLISKDNEWNPSPRRGGLRIRFWCEGCAENPFLNIFQHKGSTYIQWGKHENT